MTDPIRPSGDSAATIEAHGLTKSYGKPAVRVLDGIDLQVGRGTVFALLGPNGAGKTTTVRILATLTEADSGTARVAGYDVVADRSAVRRSISLTGQFAAVDETQTGEENLRMMARLTGQSRAAARRRAAELLERFGLTAAARRPVRTYSGGMRRRLDLAAGLVGSPEPGVFFLDEPTTGLDPRSRQELWEAVRELAARGGLLSAGFGAATTATAVSEDMKGGIIDRFRSLDVGGTPVLAGHVAASTVRNLCSTALVFGVALLIGFRPAAAWSGWLVVGAVLVAYTVALSWISAAIGLLARTPEAASGFTFFMSFLPYPSSAFVPTGNMPDWLHGFADHQPVTPAIESLRGLLLGQEVGNTPWTALAWAAGMLAVAVGASGTLFRIRTR
ncbi:hypothetical protein AMK23_31520 [Streptomyces sp. CB02130]|uniref:ABC transporter ATP-binding protein/permease n=1 Tax=Streptomyces sp. CB02130 TaxID=1703934 RepID=UPI000965E2D0|nr:ATP-binding cassette domain-containing protein [Streptomyces sp. CB02130]OKJ21202.1 hypothetical protein AMK23_31520 [Streptomyces sp. CB02130]